MSITHAEVQRIRQNAIFNGPVTRDQVQRLAQSWLTQHQALARAETALDAAERQIAARTGETAAERLLKARATRAEARLQAVRDALERARDEFEQPNEAAIRAALAEGGERR